MWNIFILSCFSSHLLAMDWPVASILHTTLQWYEHAAIRMHKTSNRYTAFVRCACKEYKFSDNAHKMHLIEQVMGPDTGLYPSDISCIVLVKSCWSSMSDATKDAWGKRADFLNAYPRTGMFLTLPADSPADSKSETRVCLKQECFALQQRLVHLLRKENSKSI